VTLSEAKRIKRGETLVREAEAIIAAHNAARARRRSRSPRATGTDKEAKRQKRNEGMREIRAKVMERAGGRCEICGSAATEAHHLISGPLRRRMESADTVVALCVAHHLAAHRGGLATLEALHLYCEGSGMHDAAAALAKRMDKIHEARSAP
jgi:hypothetical protein